MSELPSQEILATARHYVRNCALSVIPVKTDFSKRPDLDTWAYFQTAQPTDSDLVRWFGQGVERAIGIVCGAGSGNLEVIDCDEPALWLDWVELVRLHAPGLYERLTISETPSGGRHVLYRTVAPVPGNLKLAMRLITGEEGKPKLKTLFETRGQGGMIVAPGSPLSTHATGKPYKGIQGNPATIPTITRDKRDLLIASARSLTEIPVEEPREKREYQKPERSLANSLRPGDDFNERGDIESVLLYHGWTVAKRRCGKVFLRKPGKRHGHQATLHVVAHNVLYVFSTSAYPFEPERGYSAFRVYATLEHGNDFNSAAKALSGLGYGEQSPKIIFGSKRKPFNLEKPQPPTSTMSLIQPVPPVSILIGGGTGYEI